MSVIGIDDGSDEVVVGVIIAIVIGCIVVALGGGFFVYKWNQKRKEKIGKELEESLIDRDTLNVPKEEEESEESEESD